MEDKPFHVEIEYEGSRKSSWIVMMPSFKDVLEGLGHLQEHFHKVTVTQIHANPSVVIAKLGNAPPVEANRIYSFSPGMGIYCPLQFVGLCCNIKHHTHTREELNPLPLELISKLPYVDRVEDV